MQQLFDAIYFLHSNNVLHGDIRFENILLQETNCSRPTIKLIHFYNMIEFTPGKLTEIDY